MTLRKLLRSVSLGKYDTKMYLEDGEDAYSSSLGGIITIICGLIIMSYAIIAINSVLQRDTIYLDTTNREI